MESTRSKYILMIEKVNDAFLRSVFKKEYGHYPHLFPTKRFLNMLGYNPSLRRLHDGTARRLGRAHKYTIDFLLFLHLV
jgi:hypothetical protein